MRYLRGKTIGIIGLGNMGCALLKGSIERGTVKRDRLIAFDADLKKCQNVKRRLRISIAKSLEELSGCSDVIIIAVKPKDINALSEKLPSCAKEALYISIAAGIKTASIEKKLGGRPRVIRVMPNTPALVGEGMSAICKGRYATKTDLETAREIFSSVGDCAELDEKYFDSVTAISGSGPAYFFYLIEALIKAGEDLGLKKEAVKRLVAKTALGSARLLIESKEEAEVLRQRVTSKAGTTEAAIKVLERRGIKKIIGDAVYAAVKRSKELSRS